jgi:hypothetical protein
MRELSASQLLIILVPTEDMALNMGRDVRR